MKKETMFTRLLPVLVLLLVGSVISAQVLDRPLATVRLTETEVVNESEINRQFSLLSNQFGTELTPDQKEEVFQSRINSILINQAADRAGLEVSENELNNAIALQKSSIGAQISDAQFRQAVEQQTGYSWAEYQDQIRSRILQEKYIAQAKPELLQNISQPTAREIQQVYEANASSFLSPAMVGFSHIFIDTRNLSDSEVAEARTRMNAYASRVRSGGVSAFDEIIRESLDDAQLEGGDFGYVINGEPNAVQILGNRFVQSVLEMEQGFISGLVESNVGFHIIRVTDRRSPRLLELNDPLLPGQNLTVRQQIVQYILNQKQQQALIQALEEIITELRNEAEIRVIQANKGW